MATENEMITSHLTLVYKIASSIHRNLPSHVEKEDLVSCGMIGLCRAAKAYYPRAGTKFSTYATTRVRGAILDELRRRDFGSRSMRQTEREIAKAKNCFSDKFGRGPTTQELVAQTGLKASELTEHENAYYLAAVGSLEHMAKNLDRDGLSVLDRIIGSDGPEKEVLWDSDKKKLAKAIESLEERERMVISLYYYEELTLRELGEILGVSESRVSQIHTAALKILKESLSPIKR